MRIGIDAHMLGDKSGGNESFYTGILQDMQPDANDQVYLFVKTGIDDRDFFEKYRIVHLQSRNVFFRYCIELPILCRKLKLDLLHTQYFIPPFYNGICVCTIHDICFEHYHRLFNLFTSLIQKTMIPYSARHADRIITVSEFSKADISKTYGISPDRITVAGNAVTNEFRIIDLAKFDETEIRHKYRIRRGRFILTVGNLQPRKNLIRLIHAFLAYRRETKEEVQLVIVGDNKWKYKSILCEGIDSEESIVFTGYIFQPDLIRLYNAADCFIFPSIYEGFGLPPLEAMACGKPVAVSNIASLPEIVGKAGILFDPFSEQDIQKAIRLLYEDVKLRTELIGHAKEQTAKYSWEKSAAIIYDVYRQLNCIYGTK